MDGFRGGWSATRTKLACRFCRCPSGKLWKGGADPTGALKWHVRNVGKRYATRRGKSPSTPNRNMADTVKGAPSLPPKTRMRWRSVLPRILLVVVGLAILLAIIGRLYQTIAGSRDAKRSPEPGYMVDIGGMRLQINCSGEGTPTVVLESGLGDSLGEWHRVQPGVASFARVCSYDRAGYGSSDAGPFPRMSAHIAEEFRTLLRNAG